MNTIGVWKVPDLQALYATKDAIDARLKCIGSSFDAVFGDMYFSLNWRLRYRAYADKYHIVIVPGKGSIELFWHEFGHVLGSRLWPGGPVGYLRNNGIYVIENGLYVRFLTGRQPPCAYNRNNKVPAPLNGYVSDDWTAGYQLHPRNMSGDESGNCAIEDAADLFGNWGRETFVDNVAGNTLFAWYDANIKVWLQV